MENFLNKCLKHFLFMENLLGIYRHYYSQKKIKKCLIIGQILVQTLLHTIILINDEHFLLGGKEFNQIKLIHGGFSALSYANSISSVVTGICYSRAFISYIRSVSRVSESFQDDKFIHAIKNMYWFSITSTILCMALSLYRSSQIFINYVLMDGDTDMLIFVSVFVSQTLIRFTVVFQKIILFFVIMILVQLTKCLNSMISAIHERKRNCDISSNEQCDITREKIQQWVELYRDLVNCCEKLTEGFGRQFLFSFVMSMTYYMLLTNHLCNKHVSNKGDTRAVIIALSFVALTVLPIIAGQWSRNQGIQLHRVLARLYNTMIVNESGETEAKLIKDFIRLIKKKPIEIKFLSNIPAGMYMLPVVFTMAVNYIIVIMQFNNVI